jgi:hypothetical protein
VAIEGLVVALVDEERAVRQASERALEQIDRDWPNSEAARRAGAQLEASFATRPAWVRSAISQVLAKLALHTSPQQC